MTNSDEICRGLNCERTVDSLGLCNRHYQRSREGGSIDTPIASHRPRGYNQQRDDRGNKPCAKCERWLPTSSFRSTRDMADGLDRWCRLCRGAAFHGTTAEGVLLLAEAQGNACAICRRVFKNENWHIDHNHSCCESAGSCGQCIRGLLCRFCNQLLAFSRESNNVLSNACLYLMERGAQKNVIVIERISGSGENRPRGFAGCAPRRVSG